MNPVCTFTSSDNNLWVCSVCGRQVRTTGTKAPLCFCRPLPSKIKRIQHYTQAIAEHILTGSHTRTDEEVQNLLSICDECDKFNQKEQSCSICGCKCNRNKSAFTNKLRMKSQRCPLNKW